MERGLVSAKKIADVIVSLWPEWERRHGSEKSGCGAIHSASEAVGLIAYANMALVHSLYFPDMEHLRECLVNMALRCVQAIASIEAGQLELHEVRKVPPLKKTGQPPQSVN